MSDPAKAVFLSYASQDSAAAARICEALRATGVEVWFDQSELVGGDAWDRKIRGQIASCTLFLPVISAATQARREGYFRVEWKLAAQRTHAMADGTPFVLPVVIDATRDAEALVPDEFRAVQWTRLPGGETNAAFCARVKTLLGGGAVGRVLDPPSESLPRERAGQRPALLQHSRVSARVWTAIALAALVVVALWQPWKGSPAPPSDFASAAGLAKADAKSVAVLPFKNLSGDKEQEYFSDGLTEEVLGALRRERDLTVPGNTSCFSFKGKNVSPTEIARTLNVARLVEGSVQRVGSRVRIRVTLSRPADNSSEDLGTFTKEIIDIFALQDEVARAVVAKLTRRTTTAPVAVLTKNPEAYDAYLRGRALQARGIASLPAAIKLLEQAVALDRSFARAWAALAEAKFVRYAGNSDRSPQLADETRRLIDRALDAQPNLPEALIVRANWERHVKSDYAAAQRDLARAEALQPATAELRDNQAHLARDLGRWDEAFRFSREILQLDPNNTQYVKVHANQIFWRKGDYAETDRLLTRVETLRENSSDGSRVDLRLIWRGPAAALRLLDRVAPDSTNGKMQRVELLLAMNRQQEARALAVGMESDLIAVATDLEGSFRLGVASLNLLPALGRDETARRLAEVMSARVSKELARGNRAGGQLILLVRTEIVLGHRDAAIAALEQWRREIQLMQNNYQRRFIGAHLANLYALLGKADEATTLLREFMADGLQWHYSLRFDLDFAPIRSDPRFQELMRQQEAWAQAQPDPVDP